MKEIILFGAGEKLMPTMKVCQRLKYLHVAEIWDNKPTAASMHYGAEEIPFCRPHAMTEPLPIYILPHRYEEAIRSQLMHELRIPVEQLFSYWDLFADCRDDIVAHYADAKDPQLRQAVRFIAEHGLRIFPTASVEALYAKEAQIPVAYDEATDIWYGDWHGRRLYMKRGMKRSHAQSYLMSLIAEQSPQSAHHYPDVTDDVPFDTVIDCGAAEGCFALDYLGKVKDIYLFEGDAAWQEPLKCTFARGGGTNIHLIPRWVGAQAYGQCTTIDALGRAGRKVLLKMDIEGSECDALAGAEKTLLENPMVRVIACSYHRAQDAERISSFLLERHFHVHYSDDVMFFPYGESIEPAFRHGLVMGDKKECHKASIYLWGAGNCLGDVYDALNFDAVQIEGILDSNLHACPPFHGIAVESPDVLQGTAFDFVVITARHDSAIRSMYLSAGHPEEKIVSFWNEELPEGWFRMDKVARGRAELAARKWELRARNAPYEYGKQDVQILDAATLLEHVAKTGYSLSRFGDGEFSLMLGEERPWFQQPDTALALRLREVLASHDERLCLAIADNFGNLEKYTETAADAIRAYQCDQNHRERILELLEPDRVYGDAYVTRPYMIYRDVRHSEQVFDLWKHIFQDRNILIVEGESACFGGGSDLLEGASFVRRILAPTKDAFRVYGKLLDVVLAHAATEDLVLISLGPTATVLAADLTKHGIQAIDIGQLDNEYDWYRMRARERVSIPGKMTAEVFRGCVVGELKEDGDGQVIAHVSNDMKTAPPA